MQDAELWQSPVGCTADCKEHAAFLDWCRRKKLRFPKCCINHQPATTGRCVVANASIATGEIVVEVPDDAVLMSENCAIATQLSDEGLAKDTSEDDIFEVQGLILAVMHEKSLGCQSRWAPYLSFLPDDISHMPFTWKAKDRLELKGTSGYDKMVGKIQRPADAPTKVKKLFQEVAWPFVSTHSDHFNLSEGDAFRSYCWATAVVASYSFILGDDKYQGMVPMWDILNHVTGQANVRLHHNARRGVLQMIATCDIPEGAEVINNYGPHSNSELLRGYGFVELHNTNENAQVPAAFALSVCQQLLATQQEAAGSMQTQCDPAACSGTTSTARRTGSGYQTQGQASHDATRRKRPRADPQAAPHMSQSCGMTRRKRHAPHIHTAAYGHGHHHSHMAASMTGTRHGNGAATAHGAKRDSWEAGDGEDGPDHQRKRRQRARMAFCRRHGIIPETDVFKVQQDGRLPPQLTELIRILLLPDHEFAELRKLAQGWHAPLVRPMSSGMARQLLPSVLQGLQALMTKMLARYTCSLEEDEVRMQQLASLPPRLAAAVIARVGEKRCLHACLQWLQQQQPEALLDHPRLAWLMPAACEDLDKETAPAKTVQRPNGAALGEGMIAGTAGTAGMVQPLNHKPAQPFQFGFTL